MRPWARLALVAVTALVVAQILVQRAGRDPGPGTPAPPLRLPALAGGTVDLAGLRGRVVAVNFWATWCLPCRQELPELAEAWLAARGGCFEVLGVVEESAADDVAEAARSIPYPVLLDARAEAAAAWGVPGYPRTYLVDAGGAVRQVFDGAVRRGELEAAARPLLPAACPGG
jgi:cytochrome c biogenesis protein CcmG/thiol:disulfide interchange protein DsbE